MAAESGELVPVSMDSHGHTRCTWTSHRRKMRNEVFRSKWIPEHPSVITPVSGLIVFCFCFLKSSVFLWCFDIWRLEDSGKDGSSQHQLIPRNSVPTFDMQINESWVHTPTHILLLGSWNLESYLFALNHPKTRYQTTRDYPHIPEPAKKLSNYPILNWLALHWPFCPVETCVSFFLCSPEWAWCFPQACMARRTPPPGTCA